MRRQKMRSRFQICVLASLFTLVCLVVLGKYYSNLTIWKPTPDLESLAGLSSDSYDVTENALSPSLREGDAKWLETAPSYVKAIMDSKDKSFPRLSCSSPNHERYQYLRSSSPGSSKDKPRYFFALNLHECAGLLPRLLGSIVETIRFLGAENCALSIVEGRSTDGTFEILLIFQMEMEKLGIPFFLGTSDINPTADGVNRITALAELRNLALKPLENMTEPLRPVIIFINDVALCMEDLLELIHQKVYQKADMTCGMDWIFNGTAFYDVWISRGMNGDQFFEIPQSASWEFSDNLFWNDPKTRHRLEMKLPFQVFSCWNGVAVFTARPIIEKQVEFRSSRNRECLLGEPTLLCKDLWYLGYGKIAVIPSVNVGYSDEEATAVKSRHGYVSQWVAEEESQRNKTLIDWELKPPDLVKCVPTYANPSWVPWDETLKHSERRQPGMIHR